MTRLPSPSEDAARWVATHLGDLCDDVPTASPRFRGGQGPADEALDRFTVAGYATRRNEVWPPVRRGASGLSPWIRHGLLSLPKVWAAVEGGPRRDVERFRDELLWQEYARHLYARLGHRTARALRVTPPAVPGPVEGDPWDRTMACVDVAITELETDGWLVNQTRMWLASHWTVRHGAPWQEGEDRFFRHLLDGSRAANRLGWQWTAGTATGRPYGFSRRQVERRAPGLCTTCPHRTSCPIERWPDTGAAQRLPPDARLRRDPDPLGTAGPTRALSTPGPAPEAVWLTAESLGERDPAHVAHPDLPVVFVYDEALLARLRVSGKRLVFLAECLADLARIGVEVVVHRGDPVHVLSEHRVAATHAPVPGWRAKARHVRPVAVHPWPWLHRPGPGPVTSFSAWRRSLDPIQPATPGSSTR